MNTDTLYMGPFNNVIIYNFFVKFLTDINHTFCGVKTLPLLKIVTVNQSLF